VGDVHFVFRSKPRRSLHEHRQMSRDRLDKGALAGVEGKAERN
jgi:hypothetical protein